MAMFCYFVDVASNSLFIKKEETLWKIKTCVLRL
jgi:hypothetical protein